MTDDTDYDKPRQMRIPDDEWGPFESAAKAQRPEGRSPRAAVVRQFIRWYMRRPGAKLPDRPAAGPWSVSSNACDAANYSDRCELRAGHEGRHKDGISSWPQGVKRPVNPARHERPVGSEETTT